MKGKTIGELKVGDSASFEKTVSEADVYLFAGITGDSNPAHINALWAETGNFKKRVAHGVLTAGFISTVLGTQLPGPGTIYLGQELKFTAPVFFGDTIKAEATVSELRTEKNICKLHTVCTNQNGVVVIEGTATVMPPK
jgi:3-hydroxybutyryl-CoA dehydratase